MIWSVVFETPTASSTLLNLEITHGSWIAQGLAVGVSDRRRSLTAKMKHWALEYVIFRPTLRADPLPFCVCTKYLYALSHRFYI